MTTSKKQVSIKRKPKDGRPTNEADVENTVVKSEAAITSAEVKKCEEQSQVLTSRRVWPD